MRHRPLCIVFLSFVIFIFISKASGVFLWNEPDAGLKELAGAIEDTDCVIYGRVSLREEKSNSISYFLKDSYLIKDTSFKEASLDSLYEKPVFPLHNICLYTSKEDPVIKIGSDIIIFGQPEVYENAKNPGGFDAAYYYAADDCCISVFSSRYKILTEPGVSFSEASARLKEELRENLKEHMRGGSAAALSAMLFGDRTDLTAQIKLDYSASGLSHILAISGMHVAVIGNFVYRMLLKARLRIKPAAALSVFVVVMYCIFSGSSESTVRAAIMFAVMHIGRCCLRNYDQINALCLAGIIMLAVSPMSLFRAGFQLSFSAAGAVSCTAPVIKSRIEDRLKNRGRTLDEKTLAGRVKKSVIDSVSVWIGVNLLTFPIVLYHFFEFPIYSIITNMIFVPLVQTVMILGFAGAFLSLLLPWAADALLFLPDMILYMQDAAGSLILKLPFSAVTVGKPQWWQILTAYFFIILFILMLRKQKTDRNRRDIRAILKTYGFLPLALIAVMHIPEGFSITALDVGQGDCIFIRNSRYVYMVDGGSSSESSIGQYSILPYIRSQGITAIEGIFLTHDDADHLNGIDELLELKRQGMTGVRINRFFIPYWLGSTDEGKGIIQAACDAGAQVFLLKAGDEISFGEVYIEVLSPEVNDALEGNEGSLVLSVGYEGFKALLTGDLEGEGEERLLGKLGRYDCLKAAHHGSRNSGTEEFYREVSPAVCIISAPEKSIYGHPHKETLERIEEAGAKWYQTGISGAVRIEAADGTMTVETYLK
jgi:competence protein ComEC